MGEGFGAGPAASIAHQRIIANRGGRIEPAFHVARIQPVAVLGGPNPGIAIGLKLEPHGQRIGLARVLRLQTADLVGYPSQFLDVVAVFVGDHVIAGEFAARAQFAVHLVEEIGVEVDPLIGRAIERPHRTLRGAAARLAGLAEEHQLGRLERDIGSAEHWRPGLVERGQRVAALQAAFINPARIAHSRSAFDLGLLGGGLNLFQAAN